MKNTFVIRWTMRCTNPIRMMYTKNIFCFEAFWYVSVSLMMKMMMMMMMMMIGEFHDLGMI